MNKWIGMGRLTKDPEVRYSQGDNSTAIARFNMAIDRIKTANNQEPGADFISCVAFGKNGEFAEKYLKKGTKIVAEGHIQTGSYTNKDNVKVYTTDVIIERMEFAESKSNQSGNTEQGNKAPEVDANGFMNIPDGLEDELPFA